MPLTNGLVLAGGQRTGREVGEWLTSSCSQPGRIAINVNPQKPRDVPSEEVGVSWCNRDINICHVHNLGVEFEAEGFDPSMMKPGCVHRVSRPEHLARLHQHNRDMRTEQRQRWPPYQEGRVWCACLGGEPRDIAVKLLYASKMTRGVTW